jgi:hypothetical protein
MHGNALDLKAKLGWSNEVLCYMIGLLSIPFV